MKNIQDINPREEIVNPEKEKTDLEAWEEQTENEIFDDDDFIGDLEEEE
ncbi:hypothetical protein [Desertivirga arenae]|nr:hypothetical protein [Pedobacter sp. SYSU D00823]